jgi:hypothetical protein
MRLQRILKCSLKRQCHLEKFFVVAVDGCDIRMRRTECFAIMRLVLVQHEESILILMPLSTSNDILLRETIVVLWVTGSQRLFDMDDFLPSASFFLPYFSHQGRLRQGSCCRCPCGILVGPGLRHGLHC